MNFANAFEKERLRSIWVEIPIKLILSLFAISRSVESFSDIKWGDIYAFLVLYSALTIIFALMKLTGSLISGVILFVILLAVGMFIELPAWFDFVLSIVLLIGGIGVDGRKIYRFFKLSKDIVQDEQEEYAEDYQQSQTVPEVNTDFPTSGGSPFDPFAGCTDEESLKKRYKELSKSFHPDLNNGDNESMQFINSEYEKLKVQYRN